MTTYPEEPVSKAAYADSLDALFAEPPHGDDRSPSGQPGDSAIPGIPPALLYAGLAGTAVVLTALLWAASVFAGSVWWSLDLIRHSVGQLYWAVGLAVGWGAWAHGRLSWRVRGLEARLQVLEAREIRS